MVDGFLRACFKLPWRFKFFGLFLVGVLFGDLGLLDFEAFATARLTSRPISSVVGGRVATSVTTVIGALEVLILSEIAASSFLAMAFALFVARTNKLVLPLEVQGGRLHHQLSDIQQDVQDH